MTSEDEEKVERVRTKTLVADAMYQIPDMVTDNEVAQVCQSRPAPFALTLSLSLPLLLRLSSSLPLFLRLSLSVWTAGWLLRRGSTLHSRSSPDRFL